MTPPLPRTAAFLVATLLSVFAILWPQDSHAYAWMIRHEYTGCATCHTDPSGGFLLTQYGRAQTQTILSSFGRAHDGEPSGLGKFAFGVLDLPDWLNVGITQRNLVQWTKLEGGAAETRHVWMQTDARVAVTFGRFEVAGSLGYAHEGAQLAAVTSRPQDNLVSREFWLGYRLDEDGNQRLRVGRMYLPFGVRSIDHYYYVRRGTQTDLDSHQQYGVSYFRQSDLYRFEVMAIAGNYQLRPDQYRQRGYAGYIEFVAAPRLALGVSSLITRQAESMNPMVRGSSWRGAHGPFVRWSPHSSVAVLSEWDLLHETASGSAGTRLGMAGLLQADWEPWTGLHLAVTPELLWTDTKQGSGGLAYRGWLTGAWFVLPHLDLRADVVRGRDIYGPVQIDFTMALGQVHLTI